MRLITFAIPFYRGKDLLKKACESVLGQTEGNWKLIVSDDSGTSEAREIVEGLGDRRVSYHANPHRLGMVGNWNRCLELADSELVTILHADDLLLPGYTALMQKAVLTHPDAAAIFCRARVVGESGKSIFSFPDAYKRLLFSASRPITLSGESGMTTLLKGNFLFCPTACLRKSKIGKIRFDSRWHFAQDLDVWTRLIAEGQALVCVPEVAYAYRRHSANATSEYTRTSLRFHEEFALYDDLVGTSTRLGWGTAAKTARRATVVKLNIIYCCLRDLLALQFKMAWEKAFLLSRGAFADRQAT